MSNYQAWRALDAVLFDLDGVLTPTVVAHKLAWAALFAAVFTGQWAGVPKYTEEDYASLVDGRPRYDGVRAVLGSRGLSLPDGTPQDPPDAPTVCGLGNRKDAIFRAELAKGLSPYPGSLGFLDAVEAAGLKTAVVSGSRNATAVLDAAGLAGRFKVVVDGLVAANLGLKGKPSPATFLQAVAELGVQHCKAVVIEDALSGVEAGVAGRFGLVIGVDRGVGHDALLQHGADIVVDDLAELIGGGYG